MAGIYTFSLEIHFWWYPITFSAKKEMKQVVCVAFDSILLDFSQTMLAAVQQPP